jgi:hypothetical protein
MVGIRVMVRVRVRVRVTNMESCRRAGEGRQTDIEAVDRITLTLTL